MRQTANLTLGFVLATMLALSASACSDRMPMSPTASPTVSADINASGAACWGQATRVFAQTGEMGEHSSQQPTPRAGLRNLARLLADDGVIPDDSMQSLGAFVASALGLSIDACL